MSYTGNVEENVKIFFQKFEVYFVATKKRPSPIALNMHYSYTAGEKAIAVYNALSL